MNSEICYCFGAGEYFGDETVKSENRFIIAVDAGYNETKRRGLTPNLIIGDFDSLGIVPSDENVVKLPCIKDDTDMLAALKEGLKRGYEKFVIFGGSGGRLSHTLANIDTLSYLASHGAIGFICAKKEIITLVCKGIDFDTEFKGFISVFPHGGNACVSEEGLKYELDKKELSADYPLGVSNEFLGKCSRITVHSGEIVIIFDKQSLPL